MALADDATQHHRSRAGDGAGLGQIGAVEHEAQPDAGRNHIAVRCDGHEPPRLCRIEILYHAGIADLADRCAFVLDALRVA
ncbi:hypothetical protein [Bosea sp. 2YAB26]|uniref:hypothetical protein n=1 Tax=Bosea sp. 2YAB26 TaxID=3237478 RepID=UPI003F903B8D